MGVILLCVVLLAHGALGADSFWYILNPGVTNFTNYTTGAAAAVLANLPLRVRDGAVITQNETVMPISSTLQIYGDTVGTTAAFLTIETAQSPVFVVVGSGQLFVRDLQISFNGTLFNTQTTSLLRLSYVIMWIGTIGVSVQNAPGPGVGLVADHLQCVNLGTCLLYLTTGAALNCSDCRFMNARNTGVSVSSTTPSAISGLNIINSVWVNLQFFVTVQSSPSAVPVQYGLPSNWGFVNNNIIVRTYAQTCIQPTPSPTPSLPPALGGGGGTCPSCPSCTDNSYGGPKIWQYIMLILLALAAIALAAMSLGSVTESRASRIEIGGGDKRTV